MNLNTMSLNENELPYYEAGGGHRADLVQRDYPLEESEDIELPYYEAGGGHRADAVVHDNPFEAIAEASGVPLGHDDISSLRKTGDLQLQDIQVHPQDDNAPVIITLKAPTTILGTCDAKAYVNKKTEQLEWTVNDPINASAVYYNCKYYLEDGSEGHGTTFVIKTAQIVPVSDTEKVTFTLRNGKQFDLSR